MEEIETNYTVMSKKEINSYRHKSERRWYKGLVAINFMIIFFVIIVAVANINNNKKYFENLQNDINNVKIDFMKEINEDGTEQCIGEIEEENESEKKEIQSYISDAKNEINNENDKEVTEDEDTAIDKLEKRIEDFPADIKMVFMIIGLLISIPIVASYIYSIYRSMSIKVSEKNFPEIYEIVKEYTTRLGLKKMPDVYIIQGNGILNAFSAFIPFKQYVELYADLVEVAYREYKDLSSLRFIIAHEMTHICLKHSSMHYNMLIWFANYIPIISSTASRAREYSCDRIAQHLSGSDGIDAIMSLTTGIHLYKKVDKEDYIENAKKVNGFFVWIYNLFADHPINTKRILALEMKEGSGKLY